MPTQAAEPADTMPLPEQDGWAVEIHGTLVRFATNAEKAVGMSPGATVRVFSESTLRAFSKQWQARLDAALEAKHNGCQIG